jgi:hypothetical protein
MYIRPAVRRTLRPAKRTLIWLQDFFYQSYQGYRSAQFPTPDVGTILAALEVLAPSEHLDDLDQDDPIFLLATGWRTGSTLLQRILLTDPQLLLWGEPLGRLALIPKLTESLCAISEAWPPAEYWIGEETDELTTSWTANLFPPASDVRAALRDWFIRWLAMPARERGFHRWGIKEVRLGAAEACLLRWLFPRAKFLVLLRHPCDAYMSSAGARLWYRWPDWPIDSAVAFARHWNRLALSWLEVPEDFGHVVVKYEDLCSGRIDFRLLEQTLELKINEEIALSARVGSTPRQRGIRWYERRGILKEARRGMRAYGYTA